MQERDNFIKTYDLDNDNIVDSLLLHKESDIKQCIDDGILNYLTNPELVELIQKDTRSISSEVLMHDNEFGIRARLLRFTKNMDVIKAMTEDKDYQIRRNAEMLVDMNKTFDQTNSKEREDWREESKRKFWDDADYKQATASREEIEKLINSEEQEDIDRLNNIIDKANENVLIDILKKNPSFIAKKNIAKKRKENTLKYLANDPDPRIRFIVAKHKIPSINYLLKNDKNRTVRYIASNTSGL